MSGTAPGPVPGRASREADSFRALTLVEQAGRAAPC